MIRSFDFNKRFNLGLFGNTCFLRSLQEAFICYIRGCVKSLDDYRQTKGEKECRIND